MTNDLTIHWLKVLVALPLLWLPFPLPRSLNERLRANPPARPRPATVLGMAAAWSNWASLLTVGLGAYLLAVWSRQTFQANEMRTGVGRIVFGIQAGAFLISVLVHSIRKRVEMNLFAPCFPLSGMVLGLSFMANGSFPVIGIFATVVGWGFALAAKNPSFQLPVTAVAFAGCGYVLGEIPLSTLAMGTGLLLFPLLVSILFGLPLLFVSSEFRK